MRLPNPIIGYDAWLRGQPVSDFGRRSSETRRAVYGTFANWVDSTFGELDAGLIVKVP